MISTCGMKRAASAANLIMRTAPMAKLGATKRQTSPGAPAARARRTSSGQAGRAYDAVHAGGERRTQVALDGVGMGEVDHDVRPGIGKCRREIARQMNSPPLPSSMARSA
jgi:hypothetical protein